MKHLFVPYEIAKQLKEKGFNEPCLKRYYQDKEITEAHIEPRYDNGIILDDEFFNGIRNSSLIFCATAPLYQQVLDWFREKHNLHIEFTHRFGDVNKGEDYGLTYGWEIYKLYDTYSEWLDSFYGMTPYDTMNEAIESALELI